MAERIIVTWEGITVTDIPHPKREPLITRLEGLPQPTDDREKNV